MLDSRATSEEFLDQPDCSEALALASYKFMEMVNRRFGGIRVVRKFLETETTQHHNGIPLRILDIGSGSCDIPLEISRWAGHRRTTAPSTSRAWSRRTTRLLLRAKN